MKLVSFAIEWRTEASGWFDISDWIPQLICMRWDDALPLISQKLNNKMRQTYTQSFGKSAAKMQRRYITASLGFPLSNLELFARLFFKHLRIRCYFSAFDLQAVSLRPVKSPRFSFSFCAAAFNWIWLVF